MSPTPAFILMLTRHDVTVPDAIDLYASLSESRVKYVGFKDVGAAVGQMRSLVDSIHRDGRKAVLEVVQPGRPAELAAMRTALELGFDLLIGGTEVPLLAAELRGSALSYFPYVGAVSGHPCVLDGSLESIGDDARRAIASGADGVNLLAYRHRGGDPDALMRAVSAATGGRFLVAGDVNSRARLEAITAAGAFAFTVGTAVLDRSFAGAPTVAEEVELVLRAADGVMEQP